MSIFVVDILHSFLGAPKKHNEGKGQISFDCPACAIEKGKPQGDGKGNLEVNYNRGIFRCWRCMYDNNMHGFIPYLIKRFGNGELLKEYLILKPDSELLTQIEYAEVKFPKGYQKLVEAKQGSFRLNHAMNYLKNRNIGLDLIKKYDIGYTIDGDFATRIIIPSYDIHGDLNYFIARSFDYKVKPKYLNPEAEKQEIVFNEYKVNWDSTIYLVEGVFDHIVIPNSIPLLGKYMPDKLFELLQRKASSNIIIVLDSDAYDDTLQLYKLLDYGNLRGKIKICVPEDGYDPSLIYQKDGKSGIIRLLRSSHQIPESRIY